MINGLFVLDPGPYATIYPEPVRQALAEHVRWVAPPMTAAQLRAAPEVLAAVEAVFSGWGAPVFDAALLAAAPRLRAVFYGAGSVHGIVSDELFARGIQLTNASSANAVPVACFTLGHIMLGLKRAWHYAAAVRRLGAYPPRAPIPGTFRATVGLVALGEIGARVAEYLRPHDLTVLACDPYARPERAAALGATLVDLPTLFARADVVSLHAPNLPATRHLISGPLLATLKPGATFINTARGAVVDEPALVALLQARPDVTAVLDVTDPEPPPPGSPLYTLPNVVLTPHIAGSMYGECARHGWLMVEELRRYLAGEPLRCLVTRERLATMA